MKFYLIIRKANDISNRDTYDQLKQAVTSRGLELVELESNSFDYAHGLEAIETPSVVYRLARGKRAAFLEVMLATKGVVGLYGDINSLMTRSFTWGSAFRMQSAGLPIIPTVFNVSKNEDSRLAKYVEELGGFPVIVKSSGGSHGEGVMKVDSITSLRSIIGFITDDKSDEIVLRKFIANARHLRLVVLGDQVIDTIEYNTQPDDFRTNAVDIPSVIARNDIDQATKDIAIKSVQALGLEFGGVDILVDEQGVAYAAEVNFPCNFARNRQATDTDIAGMMVDYLKKKVG